MSMAPPWPDHKIRRKMEATKKQNKKTKKKNNTFCSIIDKFVRISEISFVYSMLKFMTNNTLKWCLYWQLYALIYCQNMGSPFKMWNLDSAKSNMGTSGKLHALLLNMNILQPFFIDTELKRRSRSQFSFFGEKLHCSHILKRTF